MARAQVSVISSETGVWMEPPIRAPCRREANLGCVGGGLVASADSMGLFIGLLSMAPDHFVSLDVMLLAVVPHTWIMEG